MLFTGCVDTTVYQPRPRDDLSAKAAELAEQGRHLEAAEVYRRSAENSPVNLRVSRLVQAAEQYLLGNRPALAEQVVAGVEGDNPSLATQLGIIRASSRLQQDDVTTSLSILDSLPSPLPNALLPQVLELRGRAQFANNQPIAGISALMERETWLTRTDLVLDNHRLIWNGMRDTSVEITEPYEGDGELAGWLELLPLAQRSSSNPFGLSEELSQWRLERPDHPAAGYLIDELMDALRELTDYPGHVAVLLPLSGRQATAAAAIRDGMIAAHLSAGNENRPRLRIYDTDGIGAQQTYYMALQNGADFVVGPLLKRDVESIANVAGTVPTLALNYLEEEFRFVPGLYQFALSPEDEAREVARRAIQQGQTHAVALVANNEWGIRLLTSFQQELEALGGTLLEFRAYDPQGRDFTAPITGILRIADSNQRQRRLAANLAQPVEFRPRRRQDADFIFLAAERRQGRSLIPQLRFHYAADLPTYATSDIFQPGARGNNSDLNGVVFPDVPWLLSNDPSTRRLKESVSGFWPRRGERLARLYAMGYDAYRLIPLLRQGGNEGRLAIPGLSGFLTVDGIGRIHRELPWAQMRRGRPETIIDDSPVEEILEITDEGAISGLP